MIMWIGCTTLYVYVVANQKILARIWVKASGMAKKVICYYVSGHGFGHATRVNQVVHHLLLSKEVFVHVISAAPSFIFQDLLTFPNFSHRSAPVDCVGVITLQNNGLIVDKANNLWHLLCGQPILRAIFALRSNKLCAKLTWPHSSIAFLGQDGQLDPKKGNFIDCQIRWKLYIS